MHVAQGLWPNEVAAGSTTAWVAWSPHLARYTADDLCYALSELAESKQRFPSLADVLRVLRERQAGQQREQQRAAIERGAMHLPAPATVEARLKAFDEQTAQTRQERHAELQAYHHRHPLSPEELAKQHSRIDTPDAWERKARELIERGEEPGHPASVMVEVFREGPRTRQPETVTQRAERIASEWRADPSTWPRERRDTLPAEVREAVRQAIAHSPTIP